MPVNYDVEKKAEAKAGKSKSTAKKAKKEEK